ncbi:hypothetical protein RND81_13G006800 [Saponaria officinalis]|uniref:F-box domain-containing protein n=1 Tax=Saponaria officinalis TaxID=3572 RepID=A0AAW1GUP8_SAPOF
MTTKRLFIPLNTLSLPSTESPLQSVPDLLIDVIANEILPKLPAKSLLRFKAVCKFFRTLISSPEFTRLHLRHLLASDNCLLITAATNYTLDVYDLNPLSSAPATFRWPVFTVNVIGSCNGLILITTSRYIDPLLSLVLLNPSTRTYINVNSTANDVLKGNLGLGYDRFSNDYKIVAVSDTYGCLNGDHVNTIVTTVYSVNSKSWKRVDETVGFESMERRFNGVLINSHLLHWTFWSMDRSTYKRKIRIGCFDVTTEKWMDDVLLPDNHYDPSHKSYFLDLGVLDDCLFASYVNRVQSFFDVWVMKEYGVHESWIKSFSINISDDPGRGVVPIAKLFRESRMEKLNAAMSIKVHGGVVPVACRGQGRSEVLIRDRLKSRQYWWYNRKSSALNKAEVPDYCGYRPCIFKGSLVKLPDAKLFGAQYKHDTFVLEHN